MTRRKWRPTMPPWSLWSAGYLSAFSLFLGPGIVSDAIYRTSTWHIVVAAVWAAATAVLAADFVRTWNSRGQTEPEPRSDVLDLVFASEVEHALAATTTRIDAIKLLRARNPGLGLGDAATLIDTAPPAPNTP